MELRLVGGVYASMLLLHMAMHRVLRGRGTYQVLSVGVYIVGVIVLIVCYERGWMMYPLASGVLYVLLASLTVLFYLPKFLEAETPMSMIIMSFSKKKQQSLSDLISLFSNTGLIWKRIDHLQQAGLVSKQGTSLVVTRKGFVLSQCIFMYQKIFHREIIG